MVRTREGLLFLDPRGGLVTAGPRLPDQGADPLERVRARLVGRGFRLWPQERHGASVSTFGGHDAQAVREVVERLRARCASEPMSA
ncbi:MAG: hypothetical protein M9894_21375 [Planctomycetes bacterium]|nr:hypothetical protein [Planctomycetota bacterium]